MLIFCNSKIEKRKLVKNFYFKKFKHLFKQKDFIEFGSQISIGGVQNEEIHQDLRPFGVLGLSGEL